jgi:hypothetical protein
MPIKSPLSPQTIVGKKPTNFQSAQNFISGGSPLGSSVVASAANKIVGFQRANVKPVTPDISSIVKTISSNILSEVNTRIENVSNLVNRETDKKIRDSNNIIRTQIQNISQNQNNQVTQLQTVTQNIQQQLGSVVSSIVGDYKKKIQEIDSAQPTDILNKFLETYKNALDFIRFFGNNKNVKSLRDALKELSESFTESFEVAKLIRRTILKIVSQLSNLPKVSPGGGGGLNLDVNLPGGRLKKGVPQVQRSRGRGRFGLLAGLGLGAVGGGMAVNALADSPGVQPQASGVQIPEGFADRFEQIVEKFANAIEEMIKGSQKPKQKSSSGGSASGTAESPSSGGNPGGGTMPSGPMDVSADTEEEKAWLKTIRDAEGTSGADGYGKIFGGEVVPELAQGKLTIQEAADLAKTGKLPQRLGGRVVNYGAYKGEVSGATGAYQFMPDSLISAAKKAGIDLNQPLTPEVQDKLALAWLQSGGIDPKKRATEATIRQSGQRWGWAGIHGEATGQTKRTVKQSLDRYNQFYGQGKAHPDKGMGGLGVDASMIDYETKTLAASKIAQPPPSQTATTSQVSMVPLDMSSGGGGGGSVMTPPQRAGSGPTVPLLPSSDPDNFMTMYSRIVYNIVDG